MKKMMSSETTSKDKVKGQVQDNSIIRIGVIGCGAIAELYHLPALAANQQTRNGIALCDPNDSRLEQMKSQFAANFTCRDYMKLVGKVDGVLISTPPALHFSIAKFFLERGIPVLCEKPLTESLAEAEELVELSRKHGAALAVNQTRRFFPTYQKIRELIADGVLGSLKSITYHEGSDFDWPAATAHHFQPQAKGSLSDTGIHLLDSVCFWLDGVPELIESQNDSFGGPESMATVVARYGDCRIQVKVSRLGKLKNGFRIEGSKGYIDAESEDFDEIDVYFHAGGSKRYRCCSNRVTYNDFAKPMMQNFIAVIERKAQPAVSGESVLGATRLLEEAYQSAQRYATPWNKHLHQWTDDTRFAHADSTSVKKVLVTGVSGFVGGRVAEVMHLTGLFEPVAGLRAWPRAARVANHTMQMVLCDIMQPDAISAAVHECDAIVHCAYSDDPRSIVEGTRNLLEAAAKSQISQFVYLSSAEVYGCGRLGDVDESESLTASGNTYGDAKLEAEQLCKDFSARGINTTILRPSLIYGPHGDSWSIGIAQRLQSGRWGLFEGYGEGYANLIYIDDLVQAIFLALHQPASHWRVFNVNGPEVPTWNDYFRRFNEALGLPPLDAISQSKSKLKTFVMDNISRCTSYAKSRWEDRLMEIYLRGGVAGRMMKRLRDKLRDTPSSAELTNLFARKAIYDDREIQRKLGYRPFFDLEVGMSMTIQWMVLHELASYDHNVDVSASEPEQDSDSPAMVAQ